MRSRHFLPLPNLMSRTKKSQFSQLKVYSAGADLARHTLGGTSVQITDGVGKRRPALACQAPIRPMKGRVASSRRDMTLKGGEHGRNRERSGVICKSEHQCGGSLRDQRLSAVPHSLIAPTPPCAFTLFTPHSRLLAFSVGYLVILNLLFHRHPLIVVCQIALQV